MVGGCWFLREGVLQMCFFQRDVLQGIGVRSRDVLQYVLQRCTCFLDYLFMENFISRGIQTTPAADFLLGATKTTVVGPGAESNKTIA
jgi:hypothetical protein